MIKIARIFIIALVAVITPLAFASANQAYASVTICEVSGSFCVGAPTIGINDPVKETTGGRLITESSTNGGNPFKLKFSADTTKCVGVNASNNTIVKSCTDSGVDWNRVIVSTGHIKWRNVSTNLLLTGHNNGSQMFVDVNGCSPICFQQFDH